MRVVFFHRHRLPGNFSIENLFKQVREALPENIICVVKILRFTSNGFFKRLYISIEAMLCQEDINHITGDVHFIALLLRKSKTVLTIHDLGFMKHPNPIARFIFLWFWIKLPIKRSMAVTVVSNATRDVLFGYLSIKDQAKVSVIYNPVKTSFVPVVREFNKNKPVILQIGTKHNKNLSRLIEALSGIKCHLEIIGELTEEKLKELKSAGIFYSNSKNLTDEELMEKYIKSDVVSFVSIFEGFGLPIIEANAIGRVVVTSNISSMPEIGGDAVHMVDPFDVTSIRTGFLKVIEDDGYRNQLILNGFKNRKRFDVSEIASQYATLY
ncbi:MAG TPA: glycosyltransferase family 1 protein, partial [Cyclobacteriaceae bacterium]